MKIGTIIIAIMLLPVDSSSLSQKSRELSVSEITDERLAIVLASSEMKELNKLISPDKKQLGLRLYSIPVAGDCVPETHQICGYVYYLSVSQLDDSPIRKVFELGEIGEVVEIKWLEEKKVDTARVELTVINYPSHVFVQNQMAQKQVCIYKMRITILNAEIFERKCSKS